MTNIPPDAPDAYEARFREINAMIELVDRAFRAYGEGDFDSALDIITPESSANENAQPNAVPVSAGFFNVDDFRYGEHARTLVSLAISRLQSTADEIEQMLDLALKAPDLTQILIDESDLKYHFTRPLLNWILDTKARPDVAGNYSRDERMDDIQKMDTASDGLEVQFNALSALKRGRSNIVPLRTTAEDIQEIMEKIAEIRLERLEAEYDHVEAVVEVSVSFVQALCEARISGRAHPQEAEMIEYLQDRIPACRAHAIRVDARILEADRMLMETRYYPEETVVQLPLDLKL